MMQTINVRHAMAVSLFKMSMITFNDGNLPRFDQAA